jgi:hypothetical protein
MLATLGGARALLRVRWPLAASSREALESFLTEIVRREGPDGRRLSAPALAEALLAADDLRAVRLAVEISGPLVRFESGAKPVRLALLN